MPNKAWGSIILTPCCEWFGAAGEWLGWQCNLLKAWLTAGSFLRRDMPVPSFELTLLLVGCVTKPVQLAKQAEPNLTAVVCCCVKLALEGPSESCCWCREEVRTLQAARGRRKEWSQFFWCEQLPFQLYCLTEVYRRNP